MSSSFTKVLIVAGATRQDHNKYILRYIWGYIDTAFGKSKTS